MTDQDALKRIEAYYHGYINALRSFELRFYEEPIRSAILEFIYKEKLPEVFSRDIPCIQQEILEVFPNFEEQKTMTIAEAMDLAEAAYSSDEE